MSATSDREPDSLWDAFEAFNVRAQERVERLIAATDKELYAPIDEDEPFQDEEQLCSDDAHLRRTSEQLRALAIPPFVNWKRTFAYLRIDGKSFSEETALDISESSHVEAVLAMQYDNSSALVEEAEVVEQHDVESDTHSELDESVELVLDELTTRLFSSMVAPAVVQTAESLLQAKQIWLRTVREEEERRRVELERRRQEEEDRRMEVQRRKRAKERMELDQAMNDLVCGVVQKAKAQKKSEEQYRVVMERIKQEEEERRLEMERREKAKDRMELENAMDGLVYGVEQKIESQRIREDKQRLEKLWKKQVEMEVHDLMNYILNGIEESIYHEQLRAKRNVEEQAARWRQELEEVDLILRQLSEGIEESEHFREVSLAIRQIQEILVDQGEIAEVQEQLDDLLGQVSDQAELDEVWLGIERLRESVVDAANKTAPEAIAYAEEEPSMSYIMHSISSCIEKEELLGERLGHGNNPNCDEQLVEGIDSNNTSVQSADQEHNDLGSAERYNSEHIGHKEEVKLCDELSSPSLDVEHAIDKDYVETMEATQADFLTDSFNVINASFSEADDTFAKDGRTDEHADDVLAAMELMVDYILSHDDDVDTATVELERKEPGYDDEVTRVMQRMLYCLEQADDRSTDTLGLIREVPEEYVLETSTSKVQRDKATILQDEASLTPFGDKVTESGELQFILSEILVMLDPTGEVDDVECMPTTSDTSANMKTDEEQLEDAVIDNVLGMLLVSAMKTEQKSTSGILDEMLTMVVDGYSAHPEPKLVDCEEDGCVQEIMNDLIDATEQKPECIYIDAVDRDKAEMARDIIQELVMTIEMDHDVEDHLNEVQDQISSVVADVQLDQQVEEQTEEQRAEESEASRSSTSNFMPDEKVQGQGSAIFDIPSLLDEATDVNTFVGGGQAISTSMDSPEKALLSDDAVDDTPGLLIETTDVEMHVDDYASTSAVVQGSERDVFVDSEDALIAIEESPFVRRDMAGVDIQQQVQWTDPENDSVDLEEYADGREDADDIDTILEEKDDPHTVRSDVGGRIVTEFIREGVEQYLHETVSMALAQVASSIYEKLQLELLKGEREADATADLQTLDELAGTQTENLDDQENERVCGDEAPIVRETASIGNSTEAYSNRSSESLEEAIVQDEYPQVLLHTPSMNSFVSEDEDVIGMDGPRQCVYETVEIQTEDEREKILKVDKEIQPSRSLQAFGVDQETQTSGQESTSSTETRPTLQGKDKVGKEEQSPLTLEIPSRHELDTEEEVWMGSTVYSPHREVHRAENRYFGRRGRHLMYTTPVLEAHRRATSPQHPRSPVLPASPEPSPRARRLQAAHPASPTPPSPRRGSDEVYVRLPIIPRATSPTTFETKKLLSSLHKLSSRHTAFDSLSPTKPRSSIRPLPSPNNR